MKLDRDWRHEPRSAVSREEQKAGSLTRGRYSEKYFTELTQMEGDSQHRPYTTPSRAFDKAFFNKTRVVH